MMTNTLMMMIRKKIPYTSPILWLTDADSHETLFSVLGELGAGHFLGLWHLKIEEMDGWCARK